MFTRISKRSFISCLPPWTLPRNEEGLPDQWGYAQRFTYIGGKLILELICQTKVAHTPRNTNWPVRAQIAGSQGAGLDP